MQNLGRIFLNNMQNLGRIVSIFVIFTQFLTFFVIKHFNARTFKNVNVTLLLKCVYQPFPIPPYSPWAHLHNNHDVPYHKSLFYQHCPSPEDELSSNLPHWWHLVQIDEHFDGFAFNKMIDITSNWHEWRS